MVQNITVFYLELVFVANYALFKTTGKGKIQKSRGGNRKKNVGRIYRPAARSGAWAGVACKCSLKFLKDLLVSGHNLDHT